LKIKIVGKDSLKIKGNIKNLHDFEEITEAIEKILTKKSKFLSIELVNSFSLPSSYIFYFLDLQKNRDIDIELKVSDNRLLRVLDKLKLNKHIHIKKI